MKKSSNIAGIDDYMAVSHTSVNRHIIWSSHSTPGTLPKQNKVGTWESSVPPGLSQFKS